MGFFGSRKEEADAKASVLLTVHDNERTIRQETAAMAAFLNTLIQQASREQREVVFLCIGSDRSIGDALGPLVGTMLVEAGVTHRVYGTLEEPVHAFNLEPTLKAIKRQFRQPLIIGIDAGLGEKEQVGAVILKEGPLLPGRALQKMLPPVGDYHLTGVVNYLDPLPATQFLNDTRLYTVRKLAKTMVSVIASAG
ncbi:spore protease YyaC [Brevibacillus agri]|uniref:spore protease YyaC n=1 Tax=Brevibacillus agri TaxID=51101 RepID=UPI001EE5D74D|nr:spore protease YyaC [Brevibacillus agri]MCG5252831.1 spore protease YyaC [Brevibacillus agri]